ncbi:MAG: ankyrin repeat domain-containing protein [Vicinamibacterales bacterium]
MKQLVLSLALVALTAASAAAANSAATLADIAERGNSAAVLAQLKKGADVNSPQADGATALHWAAHFNDVALAKRLLAAGARPNATNDYGVTPLFLASVNGSAEMIDTLLTAGADANTARPSGETALMTAVRTGNGLAVARLLKAGANPNAVQLSKGQSALHWAVLDGHVDVTRTLLEGGADLKLRSGGGYTPILGAARQGSIEMMKLLLEKGADIEDKANDGATPLLIATVKGHTALATYLIERGAKVDGDLKAAGYSPLMWAVGTFEQIPITYKGLDAEGEWNSFYGIPDRKEKLALVNLLIAKGADVNAKMSRGLPQMAPHNGNGARPPHSGATPYLIAAQSADAEMMKLLKEKGANPLALANDGQTALMAACEGIIENTALLTEDKRLEAAQVALDHGVALEAEDRLGYRAMHAAARGGFHQLITFLLSKGADLNPVSKPQKGNGLGRFYQEGQSPLGYVEGTIDAIYMERPDTAVFLRKLGAKSIGRFYPHDYETNSPEATDKKFKELQQQQQQQKK